MLKILKSINKIFRPKKLKIKNFGIIGIANTRHGVVLAEKILSAELRPTYCLVSAATQEQLDLSRPFWGDKKWWKTYRDISSGSPQSSFSVEAVYKKYKVPYLFIPGFDKKETFDIIGYKKLDMFLLAEGPILRQTFISKMRKGIINIHAAPLPEYRGNYATYWALYNDDPLYTTAHIVDAGIDTGPILAKKPIPVSPGDTLEDIDNKALEVSGILAAEVIRGLVSDGIIPRQQSDWQGTTYKGQMPADIIEELKRRLAAKGYSHYAG